MNELCVSQTKLFSVRHHAVQLTKHTGRVITIHGSSYAIKCLLSPMILPLRHPRHHGATAPSSSRLQRCTVGQNNLEYRLKYWATRSSVRSFARNAHSFACSGLLAALTPFAALTRLLAPSLLGNCKIRCLKMTWFCPIVRWRCVIKAAGKI